MSIGNAISFLKRAEWDKKIRDRLANASDAIEREMILKDEGLVFSPGEFEEAFTSLHIKCQHERHSLLLKELYSWWKMIQSF